jgi:outer membrane protein assembly factor BamB
VFLSACGASPVSENWPGLTVEDSMVYVISGLPQRVYMVDADTGQQQGSFSPVSESRGVLLWSPVTVGGDLAYVGFGDSGQGVSGLYAFDPETGQERWNAPAESTIIAAPAYADGVVYYADSDGGIYAFDAEAGAPKPGWSFQADSAIWASPLVVEDGIYVAGMDHYVYRLDPESGEVVWKTRVGAAMAAQPTLDDARDVLYVGAFNGKVYALNADSGEFVEGFDFEGADNWIWSEVLVTGDALYVTALDGKLYALDPVSGSVLPGYPYDSSGDDAKATLIRAAPVQAVDNIVAAAVGVADESSEVTAVRDGQRQWAWNTDRSVYTNPVVVGELVYVVTRDGQLQTLNAETGVAGWSFAGPTGD